jgi:glycine/D-amino acid oxidase-like deaminating enzyme
LRLAAKPSNPRDLVGGRTLWPLSDRPPIHYSPLATDTACDAVVIGAGVTGALVAFQLVEAGFDVMVLDQAEVAGGSTSANTALLLYETDVPLHRLAQRMGESDAVQVYRLSRDALVEFTAVVHRLDDPCGFAPRPSLYLASREEDVAGLRREHEMRRRHGFAVDFLERHEIETRYAFSSPAALRSHEAAELDPVCFTRQLIAHAARAGGRVHEQTWVTELRSNGDKVELTTGGGCQIRARHAILATGYQSEHYLGRRLARENSTYALATEPVGELRGWPDRPLIWETARPYLYLRTTPDNRILIGGLDERDVSPARRDTMLEEKCLKLLERLRGLFPGLEPRVAQAWCGAFLNTSDSLPYVGPLPDAPRIHLALCYGGNGTTFSLMAAELLRDALLGQSRPEARLFGFTRLQGDG